MGDPRAFNDTFGIPFGKVCRTFTHEIRFATLNMAWAVGSRATVDPPPMDTDRDILIWVKGGLDGLRRTVATLQACDWELVQDYKFTGDITDFASMRKGDDNLILSHSQSFCFGFLSASRQCKILNVQDKGERIRLFELVMAEHFDKTRRLMADKVQAVGGWAQFAVGAMKDHPDWFEQFGIPMPKEEWVDDTPYI